jgi:hypothetical protein
VTYTYGDHWELRFGEDGHIVVRLRRDCARVCVWQFTRHAVVLPWQTSNRYEELMMKTTFDGRPVTRGTARYAGTSRQRIVLSPNSSIAYTDAWDRRRAIFEKPTRCGARGAPSPRVGAGAGAQVPAPTGRSRLC